VAIPTNEREGLGSSDTEYPQGLKSKP
jgi:hypothetical protein